MSSTALKKTKTECGGAACAQKLEDAVKIAVRETLDLCRAEFDLTGINERGECPCDEYRGVRYCRIHKMTWRGRRMECAMHKARNARTDARTEALAGRGDARNQKSHLFGPSEEKIRESNAKDLAAYWKNYGKPNPWRSG